MSTDSAASACAECYELLLKVAERSGSATLIDDVVVVGVRVLNLAARLRLGVVDPEGQAAELDWLVGRVDAAVAHPEVGRQAGRLVVAGEALRRARASVAQHQLPL